MDREKTSVPYAMGATVVMPMPSVSRSPAEALRLAWEEIRRVLADSDRPYVLAILSDAHDRVRCFGIEAPSDGPRDLIVGRHENCDVVLRDRGVALRQVLVRITSGKEGLRARILDLHTEQGFRDEEGHTCRSLLGDRHLFVRFARHHLMLIRREPELLEVEPADVWERLPPGVHLEAAKAEVSSIRPLELKARMASVAAPENRREITQIFHLSDPELLTADEIDDGAAIGALIFDEHDLCVRLRIEALSAGVLLGRYGRCDVHTPSFHDSPLISRVHLCLLLDDSGLWAIDTASTNGFWCGGKRLRSCCLGQAEELSLGRVLAFRWQAA